MKITFSKTHLKAVSRYMAKNDIRYYLKGVYVEASPQETRLVATDGYAMGILREQKAGDDMNDLSAIAGFVIPDTAVKAMLAWKNGSKVFTDITVIVPDDYATNASAEFRADFAGNVLVFKRIDGKFPDYQRVVPKTVSGIAGQYHPHLLAIAQDAGEDIFGKGKSPSIPVTLHNGEGACIQIITPYFFAVVMPFRTNAKPEMVSDTAWAHVPVAMPAADAETVPAEHAPENAETV
jgi:DNA polymerase-3 subunit beta